MVEDFFSNFVPRIRDDVFRLAGKEATVMLQMGQNAMITIYHSLVKIGVSSRKEAFEAIQKLQQQDQILSKTPAHVEWGISFVKKVFCKDAQYFASNWETFMTLRNNLL